MFSSQDAKEAMRNIEWMGGKIIPLIEAPYRYRVVVFCSSTGKQRAMFANGEHPYFCYIQIVNQKGEWISRGAGIVPVLPDGRLIMVVEQRPAQGCYNRPTVAEIGGREVDLKKFGSLSSLEFPGGAIEPGEGLKAGFLRELTEETGVEEQTALCYSRVHPTYAFGSDIAGQNFFRVVYLSGLSYKEKVETDGGLNVLALKSSEVQYNIWNGVIHSGQAAILPWGFYREVMEIRNESWLEERLVNCGYLSVEEIKISKPS